MKFAKKFDAKKSAACRFSSRCPEAVGGIVSLLHILLQIFALGGLFIERFYNFAAVLIQVVYICL